MLLVTLLLLLARALLLAAQHWSHWSVLATPITLLFLSNTMQVVLALLQCCETISSFVHVTIQLQDTVVVAALYQPLHMYKQFAVGDDAKQCYSSLYTHTSLPVCVALQYKIGSVWRLCDSSGHHWWCQHP
jgi:hypothetical protein